MIKVRNLVLMSLLGIITAAAVAQEGIFDEYREMMGEDNAGVFIIDEGLVKIHSFLALVLSLK